MADEILQKMGFDADSALKTLGLLDKGFATFEARLVSVSTALRNFNKPAESVVADTKALQNAFKDAAAEAARSTERMTTSFGLLSRIAFTQLVISQLRVLKDTLKDATKDAAAFQTKIAEIGTIADGELGSFDQMAAKVRRISDAFNIPLLETGAGLYETLSANIAKGADNLLFLENAASFSKGTITSLDQSVKLIGGTLQAFDKDASQAADVASKLFRVIDLGNASGAELATSFNRVSGQAAAVGASFEESAAAVALLTQRGVKVSEATTQVSGVLSALIKPTDEMEAALERLGFSQAETAVKTLGLGGALKALVGETDGSAEALAKLFPNVRGLRGALSIGAQANDKYNATLAEIQATSASIIKDKSLEIMATDGQRVTAEFNKLKNALTRELGAGILSTGAAFVDAGVSAERLTAVMKAFFPFIATGTGLLTAYTAATWSGVAANEAFMASAKGAGAGLLLGAGAAAAGDFLGDQLLNAIQRPQLLFDKLAQEAIEKLKASEAEKLKLLNATDEKRVSATLRTVQKLNRAYIQDTSNAARANKLLTDNAERTLDRIVNAREKFVDALKQGSEDSKRLASDSTGRVADLGLRTEDRNFEANTRGLDDAQKAAALMQRAAEFTKRATQNLAEASKIGNEDGINRALSFFDRAQSIGDEAQAIALRLKNRNLEADAVYTINQVTSKQLEAERQLQQVQLQRQNALDKERQRQEQIVARLKDQTKILLENSNIFDKDGNQLPANLQAEQAAKRQAALSEIAKAAFSSKDLSVSDALGLAQFTSEFQRELTRDPLRLQFDTEAGLARIKTDLQRSFSDFRVNLGFDVGSLEGALGKRLNTPDDIAAGLSEAATKAAELRKAFSDVAAEDKNIKRLRIDLQGIAAQSEDVGRALLRIGPIPANDSQRELVAGIKEDFDLLSNSVAISDQQISNLLAKLKQLREAALSGDVAKNAGLSVDLTEFSRALGLLKELQAAQRGQAKNPALAPDASQKLQLLDSVLEQGATFNAALNNAVSPASNIANALGSAANSAERMAAATATIRGVQPPTFNAAAPAAGSGPAFFPQLQSLSAPAAPAARQVGGSTTTINAPITVNGASGPRQTAKEIAGQLQRLGRQGGLPGGPLGGKAFD